MRYTESLNFVYNETDKGIECRVSESWLPLLKIGAVVWAVGLMGGFVYLRGGGIGAKGDNETLRYRLSGTADKIDRIKGGRSLD